LNYTVTINCNIKKAYARKQKLKKEKAFRDDRSPSSWALAMVVYLLIPAASSSTLPKDIAALHTALADCHGSQLSFLR